MKGSSQPLRSVSAVEGGTNVGGTYIDLGTCEEIIEMDRRFREE